MLKDSKAGLNEGGFFDKQERELANIVTQIDRVRTAKLEMVQEGGLAQGENKRATNNIEKTLKQTQ